MRKALIGATVIALGVLGYACKDDDENPTTAANSPVQLTATLNGASGGSTTTTGAGTFTGSLNQGTSSGSTQSSRVLSYTMNYSGITATAITLDPVGTSTSATTGTSTTPGSGTAVTLTSPISGTVSVSQSRADSISRGLYQLNIRSTTYPNGEIGGAVRVR